MFGIEVMQSSGNDSSSKAHIHTYTPSHIESCSLYFSPKNHSIRPLPYKSDGRRDFAYFYPSYMRYTSRFGGTTQTRIYIRSSVAMIAYRTFLFPLHCIQCEVHPRSLIATSFVCRTHFVVPILFLS